MKFFLNLVMLLLACFLNACSKKETGTVVNTPAVIHTLPSHSLSSKDTENTGAVRPISYTEVEWVDLIPEDDLHALENPPAYIDKIEDGSADDRLPSKLKAVSSPGEDRYQQALNSQQIRPEFNGRHIRIPGFIVPLEFGDEQIITTFFLVPFFGACIHMPPPPPNQIIYAEYEPGIRLDALYDPFWIEGTLSTTLIENDMATAAYSITVDTIKPYIEDTLPPLDDEAPIP